MDSSPTLDSYAVELQALEDYRNFSATTIQRYFRGWIVRLRTARQRNAAAQQQQAAAAAAQESQRLYKAARVIQDSWRSFNNKRIYKYYRDLIQFREAGDPRQMLRCINAREAALIDPAAGLHVRFRLGGSSFPPLVFYKIYTHRPITDIGAFGPRNYASENNAAAHCSALLHNKPQGAAASSNSSEASTSGRQQQQQQQRHQQQLDDDEFVLPAKLREYIKPDGTLGYRSTKGWYRRVDRNGWRPVAERLLLDQGHQAALPATAAQHSSGSSSSSRRRRKHRRLQVVGLQQEDGAADGAAHVSIRQQQQQQQQQQQDDAGDTDGGSEASSSGRSSPVYHYCPVVRREERARKLKQRRRCWLLKMYRAGMHSSAAAAAHAAEAGGISNAAGSTGQGAAEASAAANGPGPGAEVRQPAAEVQPSKYRASSSEERLLQQLEQQLLANGGAGEAAAAADEGADWDVDELVALGLDAGILAWSQRLDFDSYQQHWNSTAVTLGSEVLVPVSEQQLVQQLHQVMV